MCHHSQLWTNSKQQLLQLLLSLILVLTISVFVAAQQPGGPTASSNNVPTPTREEEAADAFVWVFSGGIVIGGSVLLVIVLIARRKRTKGSDLSEKSAPVVTIVEAKKPNQTVPTTSPRYSPYRIDQEVRKLVAGTPHGVEVFTSRDPEDRRAIETSLLKIVSSSDFSDDERTRAGEALEHYGFVARHCASLLSAANAFDRTSAARTLGETGSASALPFLLEALHDADSTVRNQAVLSIGELKLPSSMGVLLEMAHKHPEVPNNLLTRALSASSVEGLEFLEGSLSAPSSSPEETCFDIVELKPLSPVPDLSETSKEEIDRLSELVRSDQDADAKTAAINSLGTIDHPSVFSAILLAMADGSRMVQAAAARALSRVSFDRSEEYVRLLETADEQTLEAVADACINVGILQQNIERLAKPDPYQAYETFALICLILKAGRTELLLEAITTQADLAVSESLIHLLTATHQPDVLDALEELGNRSDIRDELKIALRGCRGRSAELKAKAEATESISTDYRLDGASAHSEKPVDLFWSEKGIALRAHDSRISPDLLSKLKSKVNGERAAALNDLSRIDSDDAFQLITYSFDDPSPDVRNAAARALYDFNGDRAASFTRALREGSPERRRRIGAAIAGCGLASDAIVNLTIQHAQKTYDAFSVLFLMAKAGEVQPLLRAIETYPSIDVRLAIVTLLALSAPPDIVPALRRMAVRGSQPDNVRSALTDAITRISAQGREPVALV